MLVTGHKGLAMVLFYTTLTILGLVSHQCRPIFRSDNTLEFSKGNWEDKLKDEVFWYNFFAVIHYLTHIWIISGLNYFAGCRIG